MLYNVAYCSNYSPVNYHQQQVGSHHHFITTVLSYLIELGYFSFQISEFPSFRVSKFPSFFSSEIVAPKTHRLTGISIRMRNGSGSAIRQRGRVA